jgi:hypothetical protein
MADFHLVHTGAVAVWWERDDLLDSSLRQLLSHPSLRVCRAAGESTAPASEQMR